MAPRQSRDHREPPAPAATPLVRDFGRQTTPTAIPVRWDVRTAYDFLFALSDEAGSTDDMPADDRRWLQKSKAALSAQVGDAVRLYGHEFCIPFASLAVDRPDVTDAAAFVRLVHATPDRDAVSSLVADDLRDPSTRDRTSRALSGDERAIEEVVQELALYHPPDKVARFRELYTNPAEILAAAREVLVRWLPFYLEMESRVGAMLQRDYKARADDRATLEPAALIEKTTGGIRWLSEPGVRRVILAPSYFARPYNFVLGG